MLEKVKQWMTHMAPSLREAASRRTQIHVLSNHSAEMTLYSMHIMKNLIFAFKLIHAMIALDLYSERVK